MGSIVLEKLRRDQIFFGDERGISVMTATIILIGLSMLLASSLISLIPESTPPKSISPNLTIQYEENSLVLTHEGGGTIPKAFDLENGEIEWKDVQIKKNGEKLQINNGKLNGDDNIDLVTYSLGDQLKFEVELESEDKITVVYLPTDQVLLSATV